MYMLKKYFKYMFICYFNFSLSYTQINDICFYLHVAIGTDAVKNPEDENEYFFYLLNFNPFVCSYQKVYKLHF